MLYNFLFADNQSPENAIVMFLITICVFIVSLAVHEFAHALAAYKMGDNTAKLAGRMTLNPFKHLDMFGFIFFLFIGAGWAKPVPVNPNNFNNYKKGARVVSISGVLANFCLGLLAAIVIIVLSYFKINNVVMHYIIAILIIFVQVNGLLVMFNILPFPSLDGFNFLTTLVKPDSKVLKFLYQKGLRILIGIILLSVITDLFFGFDIFTVYLNLLSDFEIYIIGLLGA